MHGRGRAAAVSRPQARDLVAAPSGQEDGSEGGIAKNDRGVARNIIKA